MRDPIPTDELLTELQRLAHELGRTPKQREMDEHGNYSSNVYYSRFGSWRSAINAADLEIAQRADQSIPKEDLIDELHRLADELGKTPSQQDMKEHGKYSFNVYHARFGSWNAAIELIDLEPNTKSSHRIPTETLLDALHRLADERGKTPTEREMDKFGDHAASTYRERFGSWYEALDAADLEPSSLTLRDWETLRQLKEAEP